MMKTYSVKAEIKLKSGEVINAGDSITFKSVAEGARSVFCSTPAIPRELKLSMGTFAKKVLGKSAPSMRTLEKWSDDGIARSIQGRKVEPDGYDSDGFPSWMLVMGLI